jgi:hypothetical protein
MPESSTVSDNNADQNGHAITYTLKEHFPTLSTDTLLLALMTLFSPKRV